ncbi:hypothetical protein BDV93DRAFT_351210 [Ceratobasidium sp. AG-I]|nr:hypothetical protein BDV93DRAFT_351210 [Ceratobasidium sp. AG-I]
MHIFKAALLLFLASISERHSVFLSNPHKSPSNSQIAKPPSPTLLHIRLDLIQPTPSTKYHILSTPSSLGAAPYLGGAGPESSQPNDMTHHPSTRISHARQSSSIGFHRHVHSLLWVLEHPGHMLGVGR